eukprot:tig00000704_g3350.t1
MPPKDEKKKQKVIEDKTFGMKNKNKSSKVQKFIQNLQQQAKPPVRRDPNAQPSVKDKKEEEKKRQQELLMLFKPVVEKQKIPAPGEDPKGIICQFFKQGQCQKGSKCKFSHDLAVERKGAKIDVYTDRRDAKDETMEQWTDEKLREVVDSKQGSENKNLPTAIICKFFLQAIEDKKYGWFWECPNGPKCQYRHALPPGYVLKSKDAAKEDDEDDGLTLDELIEEERKKVVGKTPVTWETFKKWKEEKEARKKETAEKEAQEKKEGKRQMTGRDLFVFNPEMFVDDDEAAEDYERDEDADARNYASVPDISARPTDYGREDAEPEQEAGPSTSSGAGPSRSKGKGPLDPVLAVDESLFEVCAFEGV